MIVLAHRRLPRRPTLGAVLADYAFLGRLDDALYAGTCPVGWASVTALLLHPGRCHLTDKATADALVCWLRELCGSRYEQLIEVSFRADPKESAR